MTTASRPIPLQVLAWLTAAVLAAHALVVHEASQGLVRPAPGALRVFSTRVLHVLPQAEVVAAAAVPAPQGKTVGAPARRKTPRSVATESATPAPASAAPSVATDLPAPANQPDGAPGEAPAVAFEPPPQMPQQADAPVALTGPEPAASLAGPSTEAQPVATPIESAANPPPASAQGVAKVQQPYAVPGSVVLKFDARGQRRDLEYHASGQLVWLHDGKNYEARLELGAFLIGSRVLRSTGQLTSDGLAPTRYSDRYRSEAAAHFDRVGGRVTFSANTPAASLEPGAQDQLSVFVQLAALLAGAPAQFPPGSKITLQTVGSRAAEPSTFSVESMELLSLPGGEQNTLRLTRQPRREYDQKIELWLAPALQYLPARIRLTQTNGDFIDQQWRATTSP